MYISQSIQPDGDDFVVASTDTPGHVSVQIHRESGGANVALSFGALGILAGVTAIDKLVAALHECRLELLRRAVADPSLVQLPGEQPLAFDGPSGR